MSKIAIHTALSLGFCMLSAMPALAQLETDSVSVRIADLNLATPAGERALHGRVVRAVGLVCGDADVRDLRAFSAMRDCRAAAMARAEPQMQVAVTNARSDKRYAANDRKLAVSAF